MVGYRKRRRGYARGYQLVENRPYEVQIAGSWADCWQPGGRLVTLPYPLRRSAKSKFLGNNRVV